MRWTLTPPPTQPEMARKLDSSHSSSSSLQVKAENTDESSDQSTLVDSPWTVVDEVDEPPTSQADSAYSSETGALNSDNEATRQTSQECTPSLAVDDSACRFCGGELRLPGQRNRGFCGSASCVMANRNGFEL